MTLRLKEFRQSKGISQKKMAQLMNIEAKTLSNYERHVRTPSIDFLADYAGYWGVTIDDLIDRSEDHETRHFVNDDEYIIIDNYRKLNDDYRNFAAHMIELLAKNPNS